MQDGDDLVRDKFDLRDLGVLQDAPDRDFDVAVMVARRAIRAPLATLAILDFAAGTSRFRAHAGLAEIEDAVCGLDADEALAYASLTDSDVLSVADVSVVPAMKRHPVVSVMGARSILAAPVFDPAHEVVALLSVLDRVPRIWGREDQQTITGLAHFCTQAILQRATLRTLGILSRTSGRDVGAT